MQQGPLNLPISTDLPVGAKELPGAAPPGTGGQGRIDRARGMRNSVTAR